MKFKRILTLFLLSIIAFSFVFSIPFTVNAAEKTVTFGAINNYIKTVGRTSTEGGVIWADQSAAGIKFYVKTSGKIKLTLAIDSTFCNNTNNKNIYTGSNGGFFFSVFINGKMQYEDKRVPSDPGSSSWTSNTTGYPFHLTKTSGTQEFVIADLPKLSGDDYYTIEIYNQTQHQRGTLGFQSITFENDYVFGSKPKDEAYLIEFVGDSITCGDGNITAGKNCGAALWEDATRGWPVNTAKLLNADWSLICKSGGNAAGLNSFYPTLRNYTSSNRFYSFTRKADVVVIGLGTNDKVQVTSYTQRRENYKNLMNTVRAKNPNVPIVWVYGMMRNDTFSDISAAVSDMGGEAKGFYTLELPQNNKGGSSHPDFAAQTTYAQILSDYLKDILPKRDAVIDVPVFEDGDNNDSSSSKPTSSTTSSKPSSGTTSSKPDDDDNSSQATENTSSDKNQNTSSNTENNSFSADGSTDNTLSNGNDVSNADGKENDKSDSDSNVTGTDNNDSGKNANKITVIVIVAIAVLAVAVILFIFLLKKAL